MSTLRNAQTASNSRAKLALFPFISISFASVRWATSWTKLSSPRNRWVDGLVVLLVMPLLHSLFEKSLGPPPGRSNLAAELAEDLLRIDFDRTGLTQVSADTAPSVSRRIDGYFQPSGIEMDIAHQFKQICISIAQYRFVTALKQMADLFAGKIEPVSFTQSILAF